MASHQSLDTRKIMMTVVLAATLGQEAALVKEMNADTIYKISDCVAQTVKNEVLATLKQADEDDCQPDWTVDVLNPIIGNFSDELIHGLRTEEAEYILLIFTVALLSWEIFHQRGRCITDGDRKFIEEAFHEFINEHDTLSNLCRGIESEYSRLSGPNADMHVLSTLWLLSATLPSFQKPFGGSESLKSEKTVETRSQNTNPPMEDATNAVSNDNEEAVKTKSLNSKDTPDMKYKNASNTSLLPNGDGLNPVLIQVALRPERDFKIDFVNKVKPGRPVSAIKVGTGVQILVNQAIQVSDVVGPRNTITLRMGDKADRFSVDGMTAKVETKQAVCWLGNRAYEVLTSPDGSEIKVVNKKL
ncbi:hypothetical protein B0J11DRAFT_582422 [Dendryphion nanum]|uniref:Uncharacterized protein n=1 Tax=Dendryphion nanum TaxID=256645 RepID=A0A9P9IH79_9PLEO|nr:hypothetical protein B0J11DRAFT_582422 [Dendryphion nanum]